MTLVGDFGAGRGPLVLSARTPDAWAKARATVRGDLAAYANGSSKPVRPVANLDGDLVFRGSRPTAWHPRPWGGYLVRVLEADSLRDEELTAAGAWQPSGIAANEWDDIQVYVRVAKGNKLSLVDFAARRAAIAAETVPIELAPREYAVDWIRERDIPRNARVEVFRLRPANAKAAAFATIDADAGGEAPPLEPTWPVDAAARAAAKAARFVEPEFGGLLVVSAEQLAQWRGNETEDYENLDLGGTLAAIKRRGLAALGHPGPELAALVPCGRDWLLVRQLGADKSLDVVAGALALARGDYEWRALRLKLTVGNTGAYLIDAAADGAAIAKAKRLPRSAAHAPIPAGTYAVARAPLTTGTVKDGAREREVMLEVFRLRRP